MWTFAARRSRDRVRSNVKLRVLVIGAGVGGISVARGLLRDGHDVSVFERKSAVSAGGGAVTIWPNGATVLAQLGVDMDGAGQVLSTVRVVTSGRRKIATFNVAAITDRLGAPVRMVPRRVLLERLLGGFAMDRVRCNSCAVAVTNTGDGVRVEFEDGSVATGDLVIGADGLHSIVRNIVGAQAAEPTGWCSWQGLVSIPGFADDYTAFLVIGEDGNLGMWPAGGSDLQWWFDLPWSRDFVRPDRPIEMIRAHFGGWSESVDKLLTVLTDDDLAHSPYPHFRHPIPPVAEHGPLTLLGDAAHSMPPTLAQGTNQALLDTMVLCEALSTVGSRAQTDITAALRWYEKVRRNKVNVVSHVASLQVSHGEAAMRPAALVPDAVMTWVLSTFLRSVSHRRLSAAIDKDLGSAVVPTTRGR
jgi:FAD-dependent urate hydroxylase